MEIFVSIACIQIFELIDTLWNVNVQRQNVIKSALFELIDTLWNVNMLIFAIPYVQIQN